MRQWAAALAVFLIACTQQDPTSRPTASPIGTPTPTSSATPSSIADLPVTKVDFSCRLPVVTMLGGGDVVTLQGGLITFPAAQLAEDPTGTMQSGLPGEGFSTKASPVLAGSGGPGFYDRARSRWVPVPPSQALPDGSAYAYALTDPRTNLSKAYVVNVTSGATRAFDLPSPERPSVADYSAAGVYLLSYSVIGGPGQGVWLLNPATGTVRQLRGLDWVWAVRDGYAWVGRFDPQDKTVWPPMEIPPLNSLVRIDLATGAEVTWFYEAGRYPSMIGLASGGRPVVALGGPTGNDVRVIDQPGSPGQLVYAGSGGVPNVQEADGDHIWFGGGPAIYLYSPGRGFQKVFARAAEPTDATTQPYIYPAGFCI